MTTDEIRARAIDLLANDLLTAKEYAHITRRHPEYVRELCRQGQIAGAMRVGGRWMIRFSLAQSCNS